MLAVVAHPDDESFGLGAALGSFTKRGTEVTVLCLTHGEASTLGVGRRGLAALRARELARSAAVLGVNCVELLSYPDGGLEGLPLPSLVAEIDRVIDDTRPDLLLVFDEGGITGHLDHQRATTAALTGSGQLPVLAWAIADDAASRLNAELGANFCGRRRDELDFSITVDRALQRRAISCHHSQSSKNRALWRRLELQGDRELFRWLRRPADERTFDER